VSDRKVLGTISSNSLKCASVIPSVKCISSRDFGWSSLLVDHHIGARSDEPYLSIATPDLEIGVATSGRYASEIYYGGRWRRGTYQTGAVCLNQSGEPRKIRFEALKKINSSTAMLYIPGALLSDTAEHLRRRNQREIQPLLNPTVDNDPVILEVTRSLLQALEQGADNLYCETAGAFLAVHILTRHGLQFRAEEERSVGSISDARLSRVIEFMSANFASPLSLEMLAAEACISKYHFTRIFRERVGTTPYRHLADLRLRAARRLLTTTDLSIAEVGAACGYPRYTHFVAAFRSRFGIAPGKFRSDPERLG